MKQYCQRIGPKMMVLMRKLRGKKILKWFDQGGIFSKISLGKKQKGWKGRIFFFCPLLKSLNTPSKCIVHLHFSRVCSSPPSPLRSSRSLVMCFESVAPPHTQFLLRVSPSFIAVSSVASSMVSFYFLDSVCTIRIDNLYGS